MQWTQMAYGNSAWRNVKKPEPRHVRDGGKLRAENGAIIVRDDTDFPKFRGYKILKDGQSFWTQTFKVAIAQAELSS